MTALQRAISNFSPSGLVITYINELIPVGSADQNALSVRADVSAVHSLLLQASGFLGSKSLNFASLPTSFKWTVTTLAAQSDQIRQTSDFAGLLQQVRNLLSQKETLLAFLVKSALPAIGEEITGAVEALEETRSSRKQTVDAAKVAERASENAKSAADSAKASSEQASNHEVAAFASMNSVLEAERKIADIQTLISTLQTEIADAKKAAVTDKETITSVSRSIALKKQEFQNLVAESSKLEEEAESGRQEILGRLTETEKKSRRILFLSTTASLAQTWRRRRFRSNALSTVLALALTASVASAVYVAFLVAFPDAFPAFSSLSKFTFYERLALKGVVAAPLVFVIWFLAVQINHAREQSQFYGDREAVAMTIEVYRDYLVENSIALHQEKVSELFINAVSQLYDQTLNPPAKEVSKKSFSLIGRSAPLDLEAAVEIFEKLNKLRSIT